MEIINVHEAKTHLSRLLQRVEAGEEIVIGRAGQPAARLVPYEPKREKRRGGQWKGKVWISPDFDSPDPELEKLFHDGDIFPR
ncbi:MAG: type II toxin-antitoxin system Phd/YefM family antitoxin [Candidatus Latescibacterota bacterium]|nr:type II toxin-antitoxin system Phd/YefM family antitoxin [Candidatus Latescibacterota bacterium]